MTYFGYLSLFSRYFGYFSFSLIHLELKRQTRFYALVVPLKTIPDFRP